MMNLNLLKFAKMILKFGELVTDKSTLYYDGDLVEGLEIFVEIDGDLKPAEDGEYLTDEKKIVIKDGKIESIEEIKKEEEEVNEEMAEDSPIEEIADETKEDDKDAKITELEEIIKAKDEEIAELKKQLEEKEKQEFENQKPVYEEIKENNVVEKTIKQLKYFQK